MIKMCNISEFYTAVTSLIQFPCSKIEGSKCLPSSIHAEVVALAQMIIMRLTFRYFCEQYFERAALHASPASDQNFAVAMTNS
jgi:hypothetical protein